MSVSQPHFQGLQFYFFCIYILVIVSGWKCDIKLKCQKNLENPTTLGHETVHNNPGPLFILKNRYRNFQKFINLWLE